MQYLDIYLSLHDLYWLHMAKSHLKPLNSLQHLFLKTVPFKEV